jgi:drug/metabolite transporter (DMT)-like permease
MAKLITGLLVLTLGGMGYSRSVHRHPGSPMLSVASAAMLPWVFYGRYLEPLELAGLAALIIASIWNFRARKSVRVDNCTG